MTAPAIVLGAVDPVSVGGERVDARQALERDGEGKEEFRHCARPRPLPRTVTVVSPPERMAQGGDAGWPLRAQCRAMAALTRATSRASPSMLSLRMSGA